MSDMWRARAPPVPLDFDAILDDTFVLRTEEAAMAPSNGKTNGASHSHSANAATSGSKASVNGANAPAPAPAAGSGLKDQKQLTLKDNVLLFISRHAVYPHSTPFH
jgi:ubiquitin-like 1-activating enzyme E1 B